MYSLDRGPPCVVKMTVQFFDNAWVGRWNKGAEGTVMDSLSRKHAGAAPFVLLRL